MSNKLKLATVDYTKEFTKWSLWYIPIFALVYIIVNIFLREPEINEMSFFSMALSANRIYMLVLGVLAAFIFLEWSVNHGLTRRIFFHAMTFAGVIVTAFITVVTAAISFILGLMPWFGTGIPQASGGMETLIHVGGFLLLTLLYFFSGFLISVAFYHGFKPGMVMVLLSVIIITATDMIWSRQSAAIGLEAISFDTSMGIAMMLTITAVCLALIYGLLSHLIRDIPIKIK